ncbi:putative WRKY transcription factor 48 [Dichanthelium oligosanthes]|uniref:Putative WRKY transcription factor 48 n=1 Tax=Dichanthelium oligosanthes TaxID=888268 RepID=A0A1E5WN93_9POAL|nr:putative WRKY transcription factor 48 [Dichanthelium oligosanthes]
MTTMAATAAHAAKPKKKKHREPRELRFTFRTQSQVDQLEDGYRWRKYGQKAVKNSPFPRSYYRCTSAACGVKKRVERDRDEPGVVVTTYEGKHAHPCPAPATGHLPPPLLLADGGRVARGDAAAGCAQERAVDTSA